jgi:hypothetical protein
MKKLLWFMGLFFLFAFIFLKSNTWETYKALEIKRGIEYTSIRHRLRWERFFNYIKTTPERISKSNIFKPLPVK